MNLSFPLEKIIGLGTITAKKLKQLGLYKIEDLLFYFPFRYDDFSRQAKISELQPGEVANVTGQIELIQNKRSPRRRMYLTEGLINDGTETLRVLWFNQPFLTRNLKPGDKISLAGRVSEDYLGLLMTSPQYEKLTSQAIHTQGIVPIYHLISTLTQKGLRNAIAKVVSLADQVIDWLPAEVIKNNHLLPLNQAIKAIHFPANNQVLQQAKTRLGFDELFLMQLRAQQQKQNLAQLQAQPLKFFEDETKALVESLPFTLTASQKRSAWEIIQDIATTKPMLRLLQGDVGSGKTIVAGLAIFNTVLNKKQAALMAPTEILAFQHFKTFSQFFKQLDLTMALLTNGYQLLFKQGEKISNKKEINRLLAQGQIDFIIGTQALIQTGLAFNNLALAVVDEQHRFGVEQRQLLTQKVDRGSAPHLLSMTATPIPRSLALAIYGELDISLLEDMPVGRKKVLTKVITEDKRQSAYDFIAQEIKDGKQAFVICPLIDESDKLGLKSVKQEFERLDKTIFKNYKIGLLHGKLKSAEREKVLTEFREGKLNILVATSIIEIGIDIPRATVMMVEEADRFGLAQLHQYRGRVGRREDQGFCFLMAGDNNQLNHRLDAMTKFNNGFELAKVDLKFRGPGEVYGLEQKGFPELKMANFYDVNLISQTRLACLDLLKVDPKLTNYPLVKQRLGEFKKQAHLE